MTGQGEINKLTIFREKTHPVRVPESRIFITQKTARNNSALTNRSTTSGNLACLQSKIGFKE